MSLRHVRQFLAMLALAVIFWRASAAQPNVSNNFVLAWMRFDNAPQEYKGVRYIFLGDVEIHLTVNVRHQPGHLIELLWGAKEDTREALMTVNGREVSLRQGGYDGFRWLRVPIPTGTAGERYGVALKAGSGRAAFVAEVRLTANEESKTRPPLDLKAASSGVTLETRRATAEAFPEMRKFWDREPAIAASPHVNAAEEALFRRAERNGRRAAEAFFRCRRFVDGWLAHTDPKTGLIPRNLGQSRDLWNPKDSAADNYPFMVLTCAVTDRPLFEGRMLDMLRAETRLTSRLDRLPDDFLFSKQGFATPTPNLDEIVFGSSEYVKDGLIPLTEWLGLSPWSERMVGIVEDVWKHAPIETPFGKIPTLNVEVDGDQLQACSRLFWLTGDRKYLDWGIRLGDYFLLGGNHPTRDFNSLRLVDHGCEVVNGLSELYLAVSHVAAEKKKEYEKPIHEMLDRILEIGRNAHGQLYSSVNPKTGEHSKGICDTWGYDYDAFYTVYMLDRTEAYREAVLKVLGGLKEHYTGYDWGGSDGYADSLEGAINLYNREPLPSAADWIDSEIRSMWAIQKTDGVIEGWHGDGNFARTSVMYALWKTQGVTVQPWQAHVRVGAVRDGQSICISLAADELWTGRLVFDKPRHKVAMHLPLDYPRINQFPEWFTTEADRRYTVRNVAAGTEKTLTGKLLQEGLPVALKPGVESRWRVTPVGQ